MSKDNVSVDDILQEFSPDSQTVDKTDTLNRTEKPSNTSVKPVKSLEQLEHERLEAISQGELSDSAINYASFTNKPNKIIENPKKDTKFNQYYTKGVVKINSRPEPKETIKNNRDKNKVSDNKNDDTSNVHRKIDSRNDKAKLESDTNKMRNYSRSHNEISNEDFISMSEKLKRAKEKKQQEINQLNSKYQVTVTEETPVNDDIQYSTSIETPISNKNDNNSIKDNPKKKKSFFQKIIDYYTIPVDETEYHITEDNNENTSIDEASNETLEKNKNNVVEKPTIITDELDNKPITPLQDNPQKKETFKEFLTDLFMYNQKPSPQKKETFKERMIDFFVVEDDEEKPNFSENVNVIDSSNPSTDEIVSEIVNGIYNDNPTTATKKVSKEIDNLLNNLVDTLPNQENSISSNPIQDNKQSSVENKNISNIEQPIEDVIIKDTPIIEETPIINSVQEDEPIKNNIETITDTSTNDVENSTSVNKNPNVFRRVKNFFLMEEVSKPQEYDGAQLTSNEETQDVPEKVENVFETYNLDNTLKETSIDEASKPVKKVEKILDNQPIPSNKTVEEKLEPIIDNVEEVQKETHVIDSTPIQHEIKPMDNINTKNQEIHQNNVRNDEDYIIPFSEETSEDAIDIAIDEPLTYKHFWQDPDFNPIDRFKSYIENTTEKYRNRKRSGEIHIEIKSTPDTSILFSNVASGILTEQKLMESREEFKQQVLNGEYDDYEQTLKKNFDNEPTFKDTSVNDFNSYEDKSKVRKYISEMKTSLLIRTMITGILCVLSLYITLANDIGLPIFDTLNTQISVSGFLMVQSAFGLVAILTSVKAIISGMVKIFKRQADSDSFASIGIVSAFLASLMAFFMDNTLVENKMLNIYMPIALLSLLCNLIGKMLIVKREENNFNYISRDKDKFGLFCMQDDYDAEKVTKGLVNDYPITAYKKKTKFTSDFIKYTYSYDMADRFSKFAIPVIAVTCLIVSIISAIVYNKTFEMVIPVGIISIFSMLISFCSCFSITLYINSMLYSVSNKYAKREGVLLGYQAIEDFYDTNSIIINSNDIFPKGSINISALKLFSEAKVDETLIYAISLAHEANSILAPTLLDMLDGNLEMLCKVENCSYEDGLGICGWIDNKRVLMGNRELMEAHNIENLPSKSKESELVGSKKDGIYISISGNLALMLIVDVIPNKKVKHDLQSLEDSGIAIAITSCDFLVSVNRISYLFGVDQDNIKVIPYEVFQETKEYFKEKQKCSTSIVTNGNIGMITNMLISTKQIHKNSLIGNILHAVACILGIIIGISFITMGAFRELTPTMLLIYNLICSGVTLLICNWRKF